MKKIEGDIAISPPLISGTSWQIGRDRNGNFVLSLYATGKGEPLRLHLSHNAEHMIWQYSHGYAKQEESSANAQ